MASLQTYLMQTQRFLRDKAQLVENPADLTSYVNQARREVAMRAQCIRFVPPIFGSITAAEITITAAGTGYTAPTITFSSPDSPSGALPNAQGLQATGTAAQSGGTISTITITNPGDGYFNPTGTITDPTGTGATVSITLANINVLKQGQEIYNFADVPSLSRVSGVSEIYMVRGISVLYSNYRYSLPMYSFSTYQAMIRQFIASQYQYVPTFAAQLGRGASGSLYMYPPPSQTYQMEWDCCGLPTDLTVASITAADIMPDPWTDVVPYYAAHLAYMELQNWNAAKGYLDLFDMRMRQVSGYVQPGRVSNPYGRF